MDPLADLERTFGLAGALAMPGWAILILLPRRWPLLNAVPALALPLALSALYAILILTSLGQAQEGAGGGPQGGFGSLAAVRALFADDRVLLAGWVHYLAFDLFVGAVLAGRMDRVGIQRLIQAPLLLLVLLLGPLGALLALLTEGALRLRPRRLLAA
jgi:hypothetical protein